MEAAIARAQARLDATRKEIRAIEKEGASHEEAGKLAALRRTETAVQKRLEGFQRRSAKLQNRAEEVDGGDELAAVGADDKPRARKKQAGAHAGEGRRKKSREVARVEKPREVAPVEKPAKTKAKPEEPDAKAAEQQRTTSIEGSRRFARAAPEVVWEILDRPERIASLIPAVESFDIEDETHWTAKVKVPLRPGTPLVLKCETLDQRRPEHARLTVQGRGAGATVKIDGTFDLSERDGGTDMSWRTDVFLTGPVGPMGSRVLQVLVRKQMKNLLTALEREVKQDRRGKPAGTEENE